VLLWSAAELIPEPKIPTKGILTDPFARLPLKMRPAAGPSDRLEAGELDPRFDGVLYKL
jgi:hypothetical protein